MEPLEEHRKLRTVNLRNFRGALPPTSRNGVTILVYCLVAFVRFLLLSPRTVACYKFSPPLWFPGKGGLRAWDPKGRRKREEEAGLGPARWLRP